MQPPPPPPPSTPDGVPTPASIPPPPGGVATAPGYPPSYHQATTPGGERAGFGSRLGAFLLDSLLYGLLSLVFTTPGIVLIVAAFRDCTTIERFDGTTEISCGDNASDLDWASLFGGIALIAFGFLVVAFLYVRAMGKTGQPWGARIVGVRVVDIRTGEPIGFWRALGRSLFANIFSSAIFYLGYLWMLWDDKQQTWQDKVVNSVVVKT